MYREFDAQVGCTTNCLRTVAWDDPWANKPFAFGFRSCFCKAASAGSPFWLRPQPLAPRACPIVSSLEKRSTYQRTLASRDAFVGSWVTLS